MRHIGSFVRPVLIIAGGLVVVAVVGLTVTRGQQESRAEPPLGNCEELERERIVHVATAQELEAALDVAAAGDMIVVATGAYEGRFILAADGRAGEPITLCAAGAVVIDGGGLDGGYGLHITGDHWHVTGLRIHNVNKGIMLDGARYADLSHLEIHDLGQEGVHFRTHSSHNVIRDSWIHDTGKLIPEFGEGVYIGSAESNWCEYTDCEPDLAHHNEVIGNLIGPNVTAEAIDVKEGSSEGVIRGNTFDGTGMSAGESWVDIKGDGYLIAANVGRTSALHGFRVNVKVGYGHDALFAGNRATVGNNDGYGFLINPDSEGTVVLCDNEVRDAGAGWSNVPCERDPTSDLDGRRPV